ncbi:MAG: hypothetical protein QGH94_13445, partial [Phycisphaerae bacterium]|nr:hypothetical protein [Phycisphaerae bacterium]
MKRHWITALAACLTLVVLAGALQAEEAKERKRRKGGPEGAKRVRRGPGGPRKMPDVGLSELVGGGQPGRPGTDDDWMDPCWGRVVVSPEGRVRKIGHRKAR